MTCWTKTGREFWGELYGLLEQAQGRRIPFMKEVYTRLALQPAPLHPDDRSEGQFGLTSWEFFYWGPFPGAPAQDAVNFRQEIKGDELAELEGLRIAAVLSISWLDVESYGEFLEEEEKKRRLRARDYLYNWMKTVIDASERRFDLYFTQHRLRDARTHGRPQRSRGDPFVTEVCALLFEQSGRRWRLRSAFHDLWSGEFLLEIERWLIRRYAFREARLLRKTRLAGKQVRGKTFLMCLQAALLPRLAASAMLGHFAIASQPQLWSLLGNLASGVIRCAVSVLAAAGVLCLLFYMEIRRRVYNHARPVWTSFAMWGKGMFSSVLVGAAVLYLGNRGEDWATKLHSPSWDLNLHSGGFVLLEASASLLLGYILQILWDDKAISEPL